VRKVFAQGPLEIDKRLTAEIAPARVQQFRVGSKELPSYRFVDLFRAIESYTGCGSRVRVIESQHDETLNSLLHAKREGWRSRQITRSGNTVWPTGPGRRRIFPWTGFGFLKRAKRNAESRLSFAFVTPRRVNVIFVQRFWDLLAKFAGRGFQPWRLAC